MARDRVHVLSGPGVERRCMARDVLRHNSINCRVSRAHVAPTVDPLSRGFDKPLLMTLGLADLELINPGYLDQILPRDESLNLSCGIGKFSDF